MSDAIFTKIDFLALLKSRKKGDRRSLQLVLNTIDLIYQESLDGFSFEKLSRKTKIARSLIYHYYPTLESLLMFSSAYIRYEYQSYVLSQIEGKTRPLDILTTYMQAALSWVDVSPKHACVWLIYFHRCAMNSELATQNKELVEMGTNRIQNILQMGRQQNHFALSNEEIPRIARMIQILITGALVSRATEKRSTEHWQNEFQHIIKTAVEMVRSLQF